jgi:tetratricopeptide (TPR) repeat protein
MKRLSALLLGAVFVVTLAAPSAAFAAKKKKKTKSDESSPAQVAPPPPAPASTKGLENKLKKEEAEEEQYRLAPASLPPRAGAEVTKDAKADQRRDEEIAEIKKVLPKQKDPNIRAQLLFKLGELWWEKSQYVKNNQEMPAWEEEHKKWHECMLSKNSKVCGAEPIPNTRMSELYRKNAVDLYQGVIKDFPKYSRLDEIRFILAYNIGEMALAEHSQKAKDALWKKAIGVYKDLIALNPKSDFVSDALVELGNYYFDHGDLPRAEAAFTEAIKKHNKKTETFALYKLAWVRYNQGQYGEKDSPKKGDCGSVCFLKQVIERAEKEKERINLRTEALRDLVLSFAKNGERDSAIKYFELKAGHEGSRPLIVRLAGEFFSAGGAQYDDAIKAYQYLLGKLPLDRAAPEWQSKIVLCYDKKSNRQKVREEIQRLVSKYGDKGEWWKVQKDIDRNFTRELVEEALYNLVTDYHQEAIKTKSYATYTLARDIYKQYIDNFPETERAYQMRFYYAEILYTLEEFQEAYEQYLLVADDKSQKQLKNVSAKNMLLAAEKLVDIDDGLYTKHIDENTKTIDEAKDKGGIVEQHFHAVINTKAEKLALTKHEEQLVAACDRYTTLVPNAEDEARVRLRAAVIFFDKFQYVEAANRFGYIIQKWPEEETSRAAAGLVLEALSTKSEWEALNKRAREFAANKKLMAGVAKNPKTDFRSKLTDYIQNSSFKLAQAMEKKDDAQAADMFAAFMKEFPASHYAPIAGYNAFLKFQNEKHLDTAITTGEHILKEYAQADSDTWRSLPGGEHRDKLILPDLTFRLAKTYELTADFNNAARLYEKYVKDYPNDKETPDAQFNASLWYQKLGEDEKAIPAFTKYLDIYKKRPKDEQAKLVQPGVVTWTLCQFAETAAQHADAKTRAKKWQAFIDQTNHYIRDYPNEPKWQILNARYRQYLAFKALDDSKNQKAMADMVQTLYGELKSADDKTRETSKLAVADTRFYLLEPEYDAYEKMKFRGSGRVVMAEDLKAITAVKKGLEAKYTQVVAYGNGDWAIAALVRIGMLPRLMATKMRNAPVPHGLDKDQTEMYKGALEDKAIEIETPAVDLLLTAMKKSFELGIYNEWTLEAQKSLAEFKPELVGPRHELDVKGSTFFFTANDATCAPAPAKSAAPAETKTAAFPAAAESGGGTQ